MKMLLLEINLWNNALMCVNVQMKIFTLLLEGLL